MSRSIDSAAAYPQGAVVAQGLHKDYPLRGREVVRVLMGIDFVAPWGAVTGIVGPSGSGKSTLLYCLAGLERPSSGSVHLLDQDLDRLSRSRLARFRRDYLGFVFQSYNLIPTMTVEQNIALPFLLRGERVPKKKILSILDHLELSHRRKASPTTLSGGEQQRVALARVLASKPRIVFADEPTGALDQRTGELVVSELRNVARDPNRAVVLVTHSSQVAQQCDYLYPLIDGKPAPQTTIDGLGR